MLEIIHFSLTTINYMYSNGDFCKLSNVNFIFFKLILHCMYSQNCSVSPLYKPATCLSVPHLNILNINYYAFSFIRLPPARRGHRPPIFISKKTKSAAEDSKQSPFLFCPVSFPYRTVIILVLGKFLRMYEK